MTKIAWYRLIRAMWPTTKKVVKFYWARWKYKKRFHKSVPPEIFIIRISKCSMCPFFNSEGFVCQLCDCDVRLKAEWAEESCPDKPSRWLEIAPITDDNK